VTGGGPGTGPDGAGGQPVRTVVVDDVAEVREGLARLLGLVPGIEVVGTARDGAEALRVVAEAGPAVVLMDMRMPVMDGLAATRVITAVRPAPAVIVLSAYGDESLVVEALLSGARGYLVKGTGVAELAEAVRAAARGESRLSGAVTRPLLERMVEALGTERELRAAAQDAQRGAEQARHAAEAAQRELAGQVVQNHALTARLAGLLDAAPVGIIETDHADRVLRWNRAAEEIYGLAAHEVLGRVDPTAAGSTAVDVRQDANGRVAARYRRSDGVLVEVEIAEATLADDDGRPAGRFRVVTDVTERRELEGRLHHQAYHDPLTGLPNRALFNDRVNAALARARTRGDGRVLVFLLDLDGFKSVNDSLGHDAGDQLLVIAGRRLAGCLRPVDVVARLGGDEFAVLVERDEEVSTPESLAGRLLTALRTPTSLAGRALSVAGSIGVVESTGAADEDAVSLLRDADVAMYAAKHQGKAGFRRFEPGMRAAILARSELENDLRAALAAGEVRLHYQPIVDLASGDIQGVEALLRWHHPTRGPVPPQLVIEVAHDVGLLPGLGDWVVRTAVAQLAQWHRAYPYRADLSVSVNVLASQLAEDGFVDLVRDCLAGAGVPPHRLVLELTEQSLATRGPAAAEALRALRRLGVRVAIDDFGTGYGSLAYLRDLEVDILKIDKSFVDLVAVPGDPAALTRTIVDLATSLRLHPVAEGVTDPAQRAELLRQHCASGQGYLFSPPVEPDRISAMLARPPQ